MAFVFNPFTGTLDHKLDIEGTTSEISGNIALNDGYISNDGGDEGIRITDAGLVGIGVSDPDATLEIFSTTSPGQLKLSFDTDSYAAMRVVDTSNFSIATGETGNITLDAGGDIVLDADGKDITFKDNGTSYVEFLLGSSLTIRDDTDSNDYLKFTVSANGTSEIKTNDNDGVGGNLQLLPDGYLRLRPATYLWIDIITLTASGTSDASLLVQETLNLGSGEAGGSDNHYGIRYTQLQTDIGGWNNVYLMHLYGGTEAKTFLVKDDGKVGIGVAAPTTPLAVSGAITIKEQATAPSEVESHGMLWVDDSNPTSLYFTNDDGNDIPITVGAAVSAGTISLPANQISEGTAAVSIGTDDGDVVFKNDSNAEWLTFNTDDSLDPGQNPVTEILGVNNQRLRLRSVGTHQPMQFFSGGSLQMSHAVGDEDFGISGSSIHRWKPREVPFTATCTYSNDPTITYVQDSGHITQYMHVEGRGIPDAVIVGTITADAGGGNSSFELLNEAPPYDPISTFDGAQGGGDGVLTFIPSYYHQPTTYLKTLEGAFKESQGYTDHMQHSDQTLGNVIGAMQQFRGSTSGTKCVIRVKTDSNGVPRIVPALVSRGSGYTDRITITGAEYNNESLIDHTAVSGLALYQSITGTGIPIGAYIGALNPGAVANRFTIYVEGSAVNTTGDALTGQTLYARDRVVFRDPYYETDDSEDNYMILEVDYAADGLIEFGHNTSGMQAAGSFHPRLVADLNKSNARLVSTGRMKLMSNDVYNNVVQLDVDTVFLGGPDHGSLTGQDYTFVHAGDRLFIGNSSCNTTKIMIESAGSNANMFMAAQNFNNGYSKAAVTSEWQDRGGLQISVTDSTGATNFLSTEKAGTTNKVADMDFTAEGDINLMAYNGFMTLNAREGSLTIETSNTAGSDIILDSIDNITLDSHTGNFVTKKAGTEFSVANSAFAGMILGYTTTGIDAADASVLLTNAFAVTDSAHKVKFVAPPSGAVEIFVSIWGDFNRRQTYFGLSDNASYGAVHYPATDDVTNEHSVIIPFGATTGDIQINHYWVVTGLTAGNSYEWWLGAKATHNFATVLKWGGDVTGEYGPFIMKATALPTTTTDYSGNSAAVYG